jgi:alcohol dehydrogenase class IV
MTSPAPVSHGEFIFLPLEKVFYGAGSLTRLPDEVDRLSARRAFIITGKSLATGTPLVNAVETILGSRHAGTYAGIRQHAPESGIAEAVQRTRDCQADILVSIGGGSPIDAAKAVAQRLAKDGPLLPQIAIPTTLSAAEFSHVAGYTDEASKSKTGISGRELTPRVVILDPEMTVATPMGLWLSSGIRALDHAVETLYAPGYHPVNDVLALQAIRDLFAFLPQTRDEPEDLTARQRCQQAAWMSYFAPLNAASYAGLSHTIGKRIGATYDVPHGVTSCILLPPVMRFKAGNSEDAARIAPIGRMLGLAGGAAPNREAALAAADAVAGLVQSLDLPTRLRETQVPLADFDKIARASVGDDSALLPGVMKILNAAW